MEILSGNSIKKKIMLCLLIGIPAIILLLIFFVWLVSYNSSFINLSDKDKVGTALTGLTTPFISIIGITLTFLAFYIQYDFNIKQTKIIEQQRINSIKQSFDPYYLMLLNQKNNFINDSHNLNMVNDKISQTNRNSVPSFNAESIIDPIKKDNVRKGTLRLTVGIPEVTNSDEVFKTFLNISVSQIIEYSNIIKGNLIKNKFRIKDKSQLKIRQRDLIKIREILASKSKKEEYYDYITVYNRNISNILHTIQNQRFDQDQQLDLHLKQHYLLLLFTSSSLYESIYALLYLSVEYTEQMITYFFNDTETIIDLQKLTDPKISSLITAIKVYMSESKSTL